ncbi:MAG: metallophosphoesterase [Alphaproteobacteria bacterium]|nr:metallophosphoesterase [Alphaproteobacteria bacterium]
MHDGPSDEIHAQMIRRRAWRERREAMEAKPSGKRWRGQVRSRLYGSAQRMHDILRPTRPLRWAAERALRLDVTELTVFLPDLPRNFEGYRLLHLTDLHLDNIEDTAISTARHIAELDSDLCIITGDIRDNIHAPIAPLIDRLGHVVSDVRAPDGVLSVLGNHDSATMVSPMEGLGIRVLLNETVTVARGAEHLHLTGLDDVHRFHTDDAHAALEDAPDGFCIALVHSPEVADRAAARHRLYLTGHTHGGQICLPGGRPFAAGLKRHRDLARGAWRHGDMVGYTSRGIGTCVLPFRSFCPGEVVRVTLRCGPEHVAVNGQAADLWDAVTVTP